MKRNGLMRKCSWCYFNDNKKERIDNYYKVNSFDRKIIFTMKGKIFMYVESKDKFEGCPSPGYDIIDIVRRIIYYTRISGRVVDSIS